LNGPVWWAEWRFRHVTGHPSNAQFSAAFFMSDIPGNLSPLGCLDMLLRA
jgi:hypothetical protein